MAFPSKEDLLAQIDIELKRLDDSRREHGWTPWLLWAAAAALVWQFLLHVAAVRSASETAAYWGLLVMSADAVRGLMQLLIASPAEPATGRDSAPRFFSAADVMSGFRPFYLIQAARDLLALYAVYQIHVVHGVVLQSWLALYGAAAFVSVAAFIGTWSNFPVFAGPIVNSRGRHVIGVVTWLLHATALALVGGTFWHAGAISLGAPEMRVAVILLGLSEVIRWLSEFSGVNPLRVRLHQVRRAVALRELDLEDAFQRFEVIIYGQEQSAAIRSRAQACLEALEERASHHESFDKLAREFGGALENARTDAKVDELILAKRKQRKAAEKALSRAEKDADWIATRIILTRSQLRSVSQELETLEKTLRDRVRTAAKECASLAAKDVEMDALSDRRKTALRRGAV